MSETDVRDLLDLVPPHIQIDQSLDERDQLSQAIDYCCSDVGGMFNYLEYECHKHGVK